MEKVMKNVKKITLDKLVENLTETGPFDSDVNEAIAVLFEAMEKMAREHGCCLSLTSEDENNTDADKFQVTFKNVNTDARYDLRHLLMAMAGIPNN
ncbi:MAG: hypothetical protein ACRC0R_02455 [Cetobacterium sp.]